MKPQEVTIPILGREAATKPLVVEKAGERAAVIGFVDLDGTSMDETIPEARRAATAGPAKEAISLMQKGLGFTTGIITGRSAGEALYYRDILGCTGPVVCEDGAVVLLAERPRVVPSGYTVDSVEGHHALILTAVGRTDIKAFVDALRERSATLDPQDSAELISTFSPAPVLQRLLGHADVEQAARSALRIASAYIVNPSPTQLGLMHAGLEEAGLRTFSADLPHLVGVDADKASALGFVINSLDLLYPEIGAIDRVLPVAFGNNDNDVRMMQACIAAGGKGVLVAHPEGGYFVPENDIPAEVIKTTKPYGLGMREAVPTIRDWLESLANEGELDEKIP